MIRVTIIILIYNLENMIRRCIDSAIGQTEDNIEIILVDDGSTDSSPQICDEYARIDSRVHVVHKANGGLSSARNVGIQNAHGKWIMLLDGDDWLDENAARVLSDNGDRYDSDIFIASFFTEKIRSKIDSFFCINTFHYETLSDRRKLQENCISINEISNNNAPTNAGVTWARVYRRSFIEDNRLSFSEKLNRTQDAIFNLYAFQYASRVDFIDIPVHHYRIWDGSASRKYTPGFKYTAEMIENEIIEFIQKNDENKSLMPAYYSKVIRLLAEIARIEISPKENQKQINEKVKELRSIATQQRYHEALELYDPQMLTIKHKVFAWLIKHSLYGMALIMCSIKHKVL